MEESYFVAMECKPLLTELDLKKEVVLTMLHQLENQGFFKLHSNLNIGLQMRFHSKTLEMLQEGSNAEFYKAFAELCTVR